MATKMQMLFMIEDISWIDGNIEEVATPFPKPVYKRYEDMSNIDILEIFLDDEII